METNNDKLRKPFKEYKQHQGEFNLILETMIALNQLSADDLQYLRQKWASEIKDIDEERARRVDRLEKRLETQGESATAQAELEADLAHAQAVLAILVANNADPAVIASQEVVVAEAQEAVNSLGLSASYVSDRGAWLQQMEFDELEQASILRTNRIAQIDAI
ncbi:MAG: hypothetical protein R2813_13645 [Flavobacteriales bacterium]